MIIRFLTVVIIVLLMTSPASAQFDKIFKGLGHEANRMDLAM